MQPRAVYGVT